MQMTRQSEDMAGAQNDMGIIVYWSRAWSSFMVAGFSIVTFISVAMAWKSWPEQKVVLVVMALFSLMMGVGLLRSIRMLLYPPTLFEADLQGVVTYLNGSNYGKEGYHIAWQDVEEVKLVKRIASGGGNKRVRTVALLLKKGCQAPSEISLGGSDDRRVVHLDASTGNIRLQALFSQLQSLMGAASTNK